MEKEHTELKQGKRKIQIGSSGGGSVGGLILLGGALAVASLVAILATRKGKRRKDSDENHSSCKQKEDQPSQGEQFILQTSSPPFHDSKSCASNGSMEMVSIDNLMMGEDPASVVNSSLQNSENNDQEIVLNSIAMCNNHCLAEEFQSAELNILSLDELDKDAKNDEATVEVAEEDELHAVKISTEETTAVKYAVEEDDDDKEKKKQAKGSSILEEKLEGSEKEEQTAVEKESPLKEMIEVKQGEAIDKVEEQDAIDAAKISMAEIPSVQSADGNTSKEEIKQAKEKLLPAGKIKVEEEEPVGVKSCEEIPALSTIEKEEGDDDFKKGSSLMKDIEVKQEAAENYAMEEKSSTKATEGDDEEAEKRHSIDEKKERNDDFNRSKNKFRETESSSKESAADEIWTEATVNEALQDHPNNIIITQLSQVKTTKGDESNKTKDFDHFISSKKDNIDSSTSINQNRGNVTFSRKEEMNLRKWKIPVEHMLIKVSMVLLFLIAMHLCFYLLCNNMVIR